VAVRVLRARNLVEVFLFLGTDGERGRALQHVQVFVDYLVHLNILSGQPCVRAHHDSLWRQKDGSACGIFTIATILSLVEKRRLVLPLHDDMSGWRNYFASAILAHFPAQL
jgi:hypothetical protein